MCEASSAPWEATFGTISWTLRRFDAEARQRGGLHQKATGKAVGEREMPLLRMYSLAV